MDKLSKQEEELMQAIWKTNGGIIKDFLDQMDEPLPPYTTAASTAKNLERKNFIKGKKVGNTFFYTPLVQSEDYKKHFVGDFVSDYFKNSYKDLVEFFAKEERISTEDLKDIINMIENRKCD